MKVEDKGVSIELEGSHRQAFLKKLHLCGTLHEGTMSDEKLHVLDRLEAVEKRLGELDNHKVDGNSFDDNARTVDRHFDAIERRLGKAIQDLADHERRIDELAALAPERLRRLTPEQIDSMYPDQIAALTPDQVSAFTPEQLSAFGQYPFIESLSAVQIAGLSRAQAKTLLVQIGEIDQWARPKDLSDDQVQALIRRLRDTSTWLVSAQKGNRSQSWAKCGKEVGERIRLLEGVMAKTATMLETEESTPAKEAERLRGAREVTWCCFWSQAS
jgi:ribosomal protein S13